MYLSPHQRTIHSNFTPPLSIAIQPPFSTTSNLPVQTHINLPSSQPYTLYVLTCAPLSSQLQIFDSTDYRYRPQKLLNGIRARNIYQLGPEPTSSEQKHIRHVR